MTVLDINTWKRKQHFEHFKSLKDPYFGVIIPFNVSKAYNDSKINDTPFFARYLHDCMLAINQIDAFKLRIEEENVVQYNKIHASATIMRENKTFGFSFIDYNEDFKIFLDNFNKEKQRIKNSQDLFPPKNGTDCIHCSAMPWLNFSGHKEPVSGNMESIPKLAFSKAETKNNKLMMNVAISVNHALVDGYDIGLFSEKFQYNLNK